MRRDAVAKVRDAAADGACGGNAEAIMFGIVTLISFFSMHAPAAATTPRYDAGNIHAALESHLDVVGQCYALHIAKGPRPPHRLSLRFTVAPDGKIAAADVVHDGLPRGTAACIKKNVKSWQLPAPGESASLEYTFLFR
jgi:hypothetical protein